MIRYEHPQPGAHVDPDGLYLIERPARSILFGFVVAVLALLTLATIVTLAIATSRPAHATWKPEYAQADAAVRRWYNEQKLTEPAAKRLHFGSCCDSSEVVRTRFRVDRSNGQDAWFYLQDGKWLPIPPDIIHWGEHAPDGRPTLFVLAPRWDNIFGVPAGTPTCFFPGEEGI